MPEINPNLYPAGGYFFVEKDGTKITGPGWPAVERKVKIYRENRGIPEGNVHAEVMEQACQRNPNLCTSNAPVPERPRGVSLKGKVFEWLGKMSRAVRTAPLDYVSDAEAKKRAEVCRSCPRHQKISHLCASCSNSRAVLRDVIMVGRRQVATDLEACEALQVDCRTAIHLAETPVSSPELPDNCWRKAK